MVSKVPAAPGPQGGLVQLLFGLTAFGLLANAVYMLAAPYHWFIHLPGDVPDFGPFNVHMVRDIGCANLVFGGAALVALIRPVYSQAAAWLLTAFYGAHALVHVFDTARGHVHGGHWLMDLPLVYIPALIFLALALYLSAKTKQTAGALQ